MPKDEDKKKCEYLDVEFFNIFDSATVVVTLRGALSRQTLPVFESCQSKIFENTLARFIVIGLQPQFSIENSGMPDFIAFLRTLRDQQRAFRIYGLTDEIKRDLTENHGLLPEETAPDLHTAIRSLHSTIHH